MYYDVHFDTPPFGPLTYAYDGTVAPGTRVLAPLGKREVIGLAEPCSSPPGGVTPKGLLAVLDPEPLVTNEIWGFYKEVAARYVSRLGEVLAAAFPLPLGAGDDVVALTAYFCENPAAVSLTAEEQSAVEAVARRGWLSRRAAGAPELLWRLRERRVITWEPYAIKPPWEECRLYAALDAKGPRRGLAVDLWRRLREGPLPAASLFADPATRQAARALLTRGTARLGLISGRAQTAGGDGSDARPLFIGGDFDARLRKALTAACDAGVEDVVVVVPEIHLIGAVRERCREVWGEEFYPYHSELAGGARWEVFRRAARGGVRRVVGTAGALFLPLPRKATVVVLEEGDNAYKRWERAPLYQARVLAHIRAQGGAVVQAGAAPSLEAYHDAAPRGAAEVLAPPGSRVEIVDMNAVAATEGEVIFSAEVVRAVQETLGGRRRAVLVVARRGYIPYLYCRTCGEAVRCDLCDVALPYHRDDEALRCRYCGRRFPLPRRCPSCGKQALAGAGLGVERVAAEAALIFDGARVGRADSASLPSAARVRRFWGEYNAGKYDVVVGTQMALRALEDERASLAVFVDADVTLNHPDFRGGEQSFRLIARGMGPADRRVIVQTFHPRHHVMVAARQGDYATFATPELEARRRLRLPPYTTLVNVVVEGEDAGSEYFARQITERIQSIFGERGEVVGPSAAPIAWKRGQRRWQTVVRTTPEAVVDRAGALTALVTAKGRRRVSLDVDPLELA